MEGITEIQIFCFHPWSCWWKWFQVKLIPTYFSLISNYFFVYGIYLDRRGSPGWLESWEGLLLVTHVSTTCAEAIFRVKKTLKMASRRLWRWLPHRLSRRQSLAAVLLGPPVAWMIFFNQGMLLLGSNHFLMYGIYCHKRIRNQTRSGSQNQNLCVVVCEWHFWFSCS